MTTAALRLLDRVTFGVLVVVDGTIEHINDAAAEILDVDPSALRGRPLAKQPWQLRLRPTGQTLSAGEWAERISSGPCTAHVQISVGARHPVALRWESVIDGNAVIASLYDATEEVAAERAMRRAVSRYEGVATSQDEIIFHWTADGVVRWRNPAFDRLVGRVNPGARIGDLLSFDAPDYDAVVAAAVRSGGVEHEVSCTDEGGRSRRFRFRTRASASPHAPAELHSVGRDITDLRETEGRLQRSEMRNRIIVEHLTEAVMLFDGFGVVRLANPAARTLFGDDLVGAKLSSVLVGRSPAAFDVDPLVRVAAGARVEPLIAELRTGCGFRQVRVSVVPCPVADDGTPGALATFEDVTTLTEARRNAQLALAALGRQRDVERARIARDIHDDPLQVLSAVRWRLASSASATGDDSIAECAELIERVMLSLREMIFQLRPRALADLGLGAALSDLCSDTADVSVAFTDNWSSTEHAARLTKEMAELAWRTTREAFFNALKHARAQHVSVELDADPAGWLEVAVRDDGVGFSEELAAQRVSEGHFGLLMMREEIAAVGGRLTVGGRVNGSGTEVRFRVPPAPTSPEALTSP